MEKVSQSNVRLKNTCKDNTDCAVVTHGFFMHTLIKEIKKAGFKTNNTSVKYNNGECVKAEM